LLVLDYLLKHVELWPSCFFSVCSLGAELPARPARDEFERTAVFPLLRSQGYVAQWHLSYLGRPSFFAVVSLAFLHTSENFLSHTHTHTHPNNIRSFIQHGSTPFPVVRCRRQGQQDIFDLGERSHFQGKQPKARNSFYFIQHRSPSESSLTDYVEKLVE
jgi:hypothetical protein